MLTGYTEDDLKGLSEAERAIIMGEDDDGDGSIDELNELADDGDEDGTDDGTDDDDTGKAAAAADEGKAKADKPADDAAATAAAAATAKGAAKPADEEEVDEGVLFKTQTPADAAATRLALETRKDEAFQKLMDGEVDAAEYKKVEKQVDAELQKLHIAAVTDSVTATLTQAQVAQSWDREVKTLIKAAAADGLDYKGDDALRAEFDGLVRVFGSEATNKGMSDVGLKASKWALEQAHTMMKLRHGKTTTAAAPPPPPAKGKRESADLSKIPPNLGKVPIAADATGSSNEFAHLDSLKGADHERALARMTPEQQDRYLS